MKPMLAGKADNLSALYFPMLLSEKLDGVRAIVTDGVVLSRSLKPIPNPFVQTLFGTLPNGTDGELIVGNPKAPDAYRKTVSAVMREYGEESALCFYAFDNYLYTGGFTQRFERVKALSAPHVVVVSHELVTCVADIERMEAALVGQGAEGVMLRSCTGPYKFGRSTEKEQYLLKVKRFVDSDAEVLSAFELEHNENEAKTNALGRTERSTAKAGKVLSGLMGGLNVRDCVTGVEFAIGTGFDANDRKVLWEQRDTLPGKLLKYKHFPSGGKDKPRHPVFLGWRSKEDMSK